MTFEQIVWEGWIYEVYKDSFKCQMYDQSKQDYTYDLLTVPINIIKYTDRHLIEEGRLIRLTVSEETVDVYFYPYEQFTAEEVEEAEARAERLFKTIRFI
ncbi:hypothetical protein [Dyadobacter sandarakinus]|uniref:Uncharacterized protein n=1 Tax=Dyadobacter sandarakinus TaxID=2747268 RepID=A0ABX7I0Z5_9BACT|nr:hypothetical protein [Dyadobacter sandarakinus]QRQ99730.1 hypothetical protein HWI92_01760 [Dyadobacter sandarakinus]